MRVNNFFILLVLCCCLLSRSCYAEDVCNEEEDAVERCAEGLVKDDGIEVGQQPNNDGSFEEQCKDEIEAVEKCYDDNNISGLRRCRYLIRSWNSCVFFWNVVLKCRKCPIFEFETNCDEFETNWCDRENCCNTCTHFHADYMKCVENQGVCQDDQYLDCESGITLDFWGKFFIGVAAVVVVVLLLFVYLKKRGGKNNEEQGQGQDAAATKLGEEQQQLPVVDEPGEGDKPKQVE